MSESPIRKKTSSKKSTAEPKKTTTRRKKAETVAETLKEALLEVRGLEASILEDVVIEDDPAIDPELPEVAPEATAESIPNEPISEEVVSETAEPTEGTENSEKPEVEEIPVATSEVPKKAQKRRRKVRYAAPLGFAVLLLAIIGAVSLIVGGVHLVQRWTDDSELRAELSQALDPVTQMCPTSFTDAGTVEDQDTLISSAIYSIAQPEYVRWLREGDSYTFHYERDELGRLIVPQNDVATAFSRLFGDKAIRTHHTVGDAEYNEETGCYHIPIQHTTAGYVPVLDTISHRGDTYTVRVSYVLSQDIEYDYRGKALEPTADMGKYALVFTARKGQDGTWTVLAVAEEE